MRHPRPFSFQVVFDSSLSTIENRRVVERALTNFFVPTNDDTVVTLLNGANLMYEIRFSINDTPPKWLRMFLASIEANSFAVLFKDKLVETRTSSVSSPVDTIATHVPRVVILLEEVILLLVAILPVCDQLMADKIDRDRVAKEGHDARVRTEQLARDLAQLRESVDAANPSWSDDHKVARLTSLRRQLKEEQTSSARREQQHERALHAAEARHVATRVEMERRLADAQIDHVKQRDALQIRHDKMLSDERLDHRLRVDQMQREIDASNVDVAELREQLLLSTSEREARLERELVNARAQVNAHIEQFHMSMSKYFGMTPRSDANTSTTIK